MNTIDASDFERAWDCTLSPWMRERIAQHDLRYTEIDQAERDQLILRVLDFLNDDVVQSGRHRADDWERGWAQNLTELQESSAVEAIIPKYFGKIPIVRWCQRWIAPVDRGLEYSMLSVLLDWVADTYLQGYSSIYEFGCGTGHNLVRLRERFPEAELTGLDWATSSQGVIQAYAAKTGDSRLHAANFDYFNPDAGFDLADSSAVFTMASLEQIGTNYGAFVDYLLDKQPALVINVEPIGELLDQTQLLDYLSVRYFEKRKYLQGYLDHLRALQEQGRIEILEERRSFVGSFFIDGYSLVIWRPVVS